MDASDPSIGKPVESLKEAQYAQISFLMMPKGSKVVGGSVRLTVNSAAQLDFQVPPQQMSGDLVLSDRSELPSVLSAENHVERSRQRPIPYAATLAGNSLMISETKAFASPKSIRVLSE